MAQSSRPAQHTVECTSQKNNAVLIQLFKMLLSEE